MFDIVLLALSIPCFIRNKVAPIMLMILCLFYSGSIIGNGIGTVPFVHNYRDVGVFLFILLLLYLRRRKVRSEADGSLKWFQKGILVFVSFLLLSYLVDIVFNHVYISSIIKGIRTWFILSFAWLVPKLKESEIIGFFRYLFYFTFILTFIFIVEFVFNITITGVPRVMEGARASIPWPLSLFVWGLVLSGAFRVPNIMKNLYIGTVICHLIICGSRSHFIAFVLVASIFFFMNGILNIKKVLISLCAIMAIIVVFSTDNMLSQRFSEAKQDLASVRAGSEESEGTLSSRMMWLNERMEYLNQRGQYIVFGLGNIQENDFGNVFVTGLYNEDKGGVAQIDTGDIAWITLFLRLGYVGTAVYLIFVYFRALAIGWRYRRNSVALTLFAYLFSHVFFTSFTDYVISESFFWFVPIIAISYIKKSSRNFMLVAN